MNDLWDGFWAALRLLISGDSAIWQIVGLSLFVSGVALLLSALAGIPLGAWLGLHQFRGRRLITALVYTGMGLPPVVVGLVVYLLLSRSGPLGALGWLFTSRAMIAAQTIISLPLVLGLTMSAVEGVGAELRVQLRSLGATPTQIARAVLWEARGGMLVALVAGFGGIVSEVGAVMLVGGAC
jgi:tungstate transport system permease protein